MSGGGRIGFNSQPTNKFGAAQDQTPKEQTISPTETPKPDQYTVKRGDTLTEIAIKTGQNLPELLQRNQQIKNPDKIYAGQKIEIGNHFNIYTVKLGDTLSEVAKAKQTTVGDLMRANAGQIGNRNLIYPGQKLRISISNKQSAPNAQKTSTASKSNSPVSSKPIEPPPKIVSVPERPQANALTNTNNVNNPTQDIKLSSHLKISSESWNSSSPVRATKRRRSISS